MLNEVTVILNHVVRVVKATGVAVPNVDVYDGADGNGHAPQLTITFPIIETTRAFDGSCWLASIRNEEALSYATRQNGLSLVPRIHVDVLGAASLGPFRWVGMPAVRVPVGSKYALPGPDILQEQFGNGGATDLQHNFYDKFSSLTPLGLLRYQYRQQGAEIAHLVPNAGTVSKRGLTALAFALREPHVNGALFHNRPGGFQNELYGKQLMRDFHGNPTHPYTALAAPLGNAIITSGIQQVLYGFVPSNQLENLLDAAFNAADVHTDASVVLYNDAVRRSAAVRVGSTPEQRAEAAAVQRSTRATLDIAIVSRAKADALCATAQEAGTHISPFTYIGTTDQLSEVSCFKNAGTNFKGSTYFDFPLATFPAAPSAATFAYNFLTVSCTPFMFQTQPVGANTGKILKAFLNDFYARYLTVFPKCIMDVDHVSGTRVVCNYDFTSTMSTERGVGVTTVVPYVPGAAAAGDTFFVPGFTYALGRGEGAEGINSNVLGTYRQDANIDAALFTAANLRASYAAAQFIGNKFVVGSDMPHTETTDRRSKQKVLLERTDVSDADKRRILEANPMAFFRMKSWEAVKPRAMAAA